MTNMKKLNTMTATTAATQVSVGTYGSIRKLMEAATLRGNFSRVLNCGKTFAAAGTDKREIRARLKSILGDELTGLKVAYAEVETVSRGRKTGKCHIVGTVSLAERKQTETRKQAAEQVTVAETHDADPDGTKAQLYAETVVNRSLRAENAELREENAALKARLAELSAALEMLSAHAVK